MRVKRMLSIFLVAILVCAVLPTAALAYDAYDFTNSSWFGQYTGHKDNVPVERYIDFTIDSCDRNGNFSGSAKVTTVEGQGHDSEWFNYIMKGSIDFTANTFHMQGTKLTTYSSGTNWNMLPFDGTIQQNANGDISISGIVNNKKETLFSVSRTSAWARDEMTQANILGLIPDTLKGADMTQRVTRAEFAAVSVKLYESLSGKTSTAASTPFTDISGNSNRADIGKAYGLGIAVGVSDTEFAPDAAINREQLATMLCRTIKKYSFDGWTIDKDDQYYLDTSGANKFADDADISGYAKPSVYYMAKMGIINGVDSTHFAPKNITPEQEAKGYATATREQAIALSLRIYKLSDMWK